MKTYVNLTPHVIRLNDGCEFMPSGQVARVATNYTPFDSDGVASVVFGDIRGLPEPQKDTIYLVSALVAQAANRADVVSPATGHPEALRDEHGHISSVPGFVRALPLSLPATCGFSSRRIAERLTPEKLLESINPLSDAEKRRGLTLSSFFKRPHELGLDVFSDNIIFIDAPMLLRRKAYGNKSLQNLVRLLREYGYTPFALLE